jgi:nanoRNase/pAp phosphatase (c-di-AMP/oligoRNAs hydrolase)
MKKGQPVPGAKNAGKHRSNKETLEDLYSHFRPKDHVLIVIDPDPDSIGSGLALKRLLWHKVQTTTIGMIRPIRRLNNLTMVRVLRLPLVLLTRDKPEGFDKYVVVDGQPSHNAFFNRFHYTAIIDHHPVANSFEEGSFVDIRPDYGSTSTILTEYLRSARIKPSRTIATTLLYGIKTDTRNFERNTLVEDIEAFRFLFPLANHNILRKIEISDLSFGDLKYFHKAVERKHVVRDRLFAHLDEVATADILVVIAEFFLKVHDVSWSIISGVLEGNLIIVVRNDGSRDAGRIIRRAFGHLGCAGGHQAMARAEIPLANLNQVMEKLSSASIELLIRKRLSPFK